MIDIKDQLCPWKLSKEIVALGGKEDSYFKWVHPWMSRIYIEHKRKYVFVKWYNVSFRHSYPAFTVEELGYYISDNVIGYDNYDGWYCKDATDRWEGTTYHKSMVEACVHAYIKQLKEVQEEKEEEDRIKRNGIL